MSQLNVISNTRTIKQITFLLSIKLALLYILGTHRSIFLPYIESKECSRNRLSRPAETVCCG